MEIKYNSEKAKHIFFTSDLHFCHKNILKFCDRPWTTIDEMNEGLVKRWNQVVGKNDTVFCLGDFCFGGSAEWKKWREKLNGHIILVKGNHDNKMSKTMEKLFDSVHFQLLLNIDGNMVYLNHYPFLTYSGPLRKKPIYQLYGHIHSGPRSKSIDLKRCKILYPCQYDVGVDNNNYYPISWEQVNNIIKQQIEWKKKPLIKKWWSNLKKSFLNLLKNN